MIQYLKKNQLNIKKYNFCIENSLNSRVYAYSWYLDCVTDNWDALVLNNYEAVMPLPWRSKYFIKYIYPPVWTQQLGVFSLDKISESIVLDFIKAIPRKFKKITIQFNSENTFHHKNLDERVNYILPLNKSYNDIYKGFNSNRKRIIKKCNIDESQIVENIDFSIFLDFYTKEAFSFQSSENQKTSLGKLLAHKNEIMNVIGVYNNKKLACCLLYLKDNKRITYLLPISTAEAKQLALPTLLVNYLLKKYQQTDCIFDFEGSIISGVANFYKSFGGKKEPYLNLKKDIFGR